MAKSPLKTAEGCVVKYTSELYRKEGVSAEAFDDWFTNVVTPKAIPVYKKYNFIKVMIVSRNAPFHHNRTANLHNHVQYKTDRKASATLQSMLTQAGTGRKVSDCDIVMEHWVHDMSTVLAHASDPEWTSEVLKDQDKWLDASKGTSHIGYDTAWVEKEAIRT